MYYGKNDRNPTFEDVTLGESLDFLFSAPGTEVGPLRDALSQAILTLNTKSDVPNLATALVTRLFEAKTTDPRANELNAITLELAKQIDLITSNSLIRNTAPFHNRSHFLAVLLSSYTLTKINSANGYENPSQADIALRYFTALGHDFLHDGKGNAGRDAMFLEHKSVTALLGLAAMAGTPLTPAEETTLRATIYATDPGMPRALASQALRGKSITEQFASNLVVTSDKIADQRLSFVINALSDKDLRANIATMLDADLLPSFGLDPQNSWHTTKVLHDEIRCHNPEAKPLVNEIGKPLPGGQFFALSHILGGYLAPDGSAKVGFLTPAGKEIGDTYAQSIFDAAAKALPPEVATGIKRSSPSFVPIHG